MSITTNAELKTAVASWLVRDDLTTLIPDFVALGESALYNKLRVRENEVTGNVTITTSTRTSALPATYLAARSVYISGTPNARLEYRTPEEYWGLYSDLTSAKPIAYTVEGENFTWGAVPDAGYTAVVTFYSKLAAFSADGDTNAVLARWPGMYLFTALVEAESYLGDNVAVLKWQAKFDALLEEARAADKVDRAA